MRVPLGGTMQDKTDDKKPAVLGRLGGEPGEPGSALLNKDCIGWLFMPYCFHGTTIAR